MSERQGDVRVRASPHIFNPAMAGILGPFNFLAPVEPFLTSLPSLSKTSPDSAIFLSSCANELSGLTPKRTRLGSAPSCCASA